MNCKSIHELLPLYLSGELGEAGRLSLEAHLAECGGCAIEVQRNREVDSRLRSALHEMPLETTDLERSVRTQIASHQRRAWIIRCAIAASVLAMIAAGYALRYSSTPRLYADAARDHRTEVEEHQPRRWRSTGPEIDSLAAGFGFSEHAAESIAPRPFHLARARRCRLDGHAVLHLVYTDGVREMSVFIRQRGTDSVGNLRAAEIGEDNLVSVESARFIAVIVAHGSSEECALFARSAQKTL